LNGTFQVDDDLVLLIVRKCPGLTHLNVRNCRKLTNLTLKHLSDSKSSKLKCLHVGGSVNIAESGLLSFLKSANASKLTELNISGLPINDATLTLLLKHCPQLTKLGVNFGHISEFAFRAFLSTPEVGSRVEALYMAWVGTQSSSTGGMSESSSPEKDPYSTDFFSEFLATACPMLTELDVSGMKAATANSLQLYLDQRWRQVSIVV